MFAPTAQVMYLPCGKSDVARAARSDVMCSLTRRSAHHLAKPYITRDPFPTNHIRDSPGTPRGAHITFRTAHPHESLFAIRRDPQGQAEHIVPPKKHCLRSAFLVGDGGFEPPKSVTTDLQSAPFGRSGNLPGAGDRSRTNNLLITNQLLCH